MSDSPTLLQRLGHELANLLWPAQCLVCGSGNESLHGSVCERCWGKLLPAPAVVLPKPIDRLAVAYAYDDTLRTLIHQFKFNQTPGLAAPLAQRFSDRLDGMGFVFFDSILVPVPAHPARLRERGYNPAELLTKELAALLELPFDPRIASRLHHNPHQSSLPDEARKRSLKDSFHVTPPPEDYSETTRLVLVDDVVHSGRTIGQLARAARKAGWKQIDAVCLCA
jgi:ComF family protein